MSEPLQPTLFGETELPSMSSAEGSLVRTSATLVDKRDWTGSAAGYGRNTPDLLASWDRHSSSWRTSQHFLGEGLTEFSETWPRSGLMRSGIAYQLPPLAPRTSATESGLLPTPTACDHKGSRTIEALIRAGRNDRNNLRDWCRVHFGWVYPHPTFVEWLMGFPADWVSPVCTPSETRSSRKSPS